VKGGGKKKSPKKGRKCRPSTSVALRRREKGKREKRKALPKKKGKRGRGGMSFHHLSVPPQNEKGKKKGDVGGKEEGREGGKRVRMMYISRCNLSAV